MPRRLSPTTLARRTSSAALAAVAAVTLTAVAATPASATSGSGTDTHPIRAQIFAPSSFWYQQLPADAPLDPNSAAVARDLYRAGETQYGSPGKPNISINTTSYTPPVYVADANDPLVSVKWDNCQGRSSDGGVYADQLSAIRIPADAVPAQGSDGEMTIYDKDQDTVTDLWRARKDANGQWWSCWGGTIRGASASNGIFGNGGGTTATGLPFLGGIIRADELAKGEIDHVVGLAIPFAQVAPAKSWPAQRSDGVNPSGYAVPMQGQMFRLPASLDIDAMKLSPTARIVAKAVQKYGAVVWDTAGAITFRAENPLGLASDPYPKLYRGNSSYTEMTGASWLGEVGFPLDKLQLLAANYRAPQNNPFAVTTPAPAPAPAPTPTLDSAPYAWRQTSARADVSTGSVMWSARGTSFDTTNLETRMAGKAIANTADDVLYGTTVSGMRTWSTPVPRDGTYRVTLFAAEDRYKSGRRVYDVGAEGVTKLTGVDIARATGGLYRAYTPRFLVDVADGRLNLTFRARAATPMLSAILVEEVSPTVTTNRYEKPRTVRRPVHTRSGVRR